MNQLNLNNTLKFLFLLIQLQINAIFHNWAGNQTCYPKNILYPKSRQELINLLKEISQENKRVCVIGFGHSFNDIASSNDYLISLKNLNQILSIDCNLKQVNVQGGILLKDFNEQIAQHGLALSNLPAITNLTLAGAISTASHGTGKSGTLSSFVTEIELIDVQGASHILSLNQDPEVFKAACVSLGALGIIYSIKMQCEPLFELKYEQIKMTFNELLSKYNQLHEKHDFFQFHWYFKDDLVDADCWNRVPSNSNSIEKQVSYKVLPWYMHPDPVLSAEIAIPITFLPQAMRNIKQLIEMGNLQNDISEVTCRFVKADKNSFLSTALDYDVAYLNIGTLADNKYLDFYHAFEKAMMQFQGRPHWGKINFLDYEKVYELYGNNFIKFLQIKKNIDPYNRCSNFFMDRIMNQYSVSQS